ncbi:hypothetical protein KM043_012692 [Ampulex compressa]|nr:hypothetical protein KM043_012692 [Ampulex compressa]
MKGEYVSMFLCCLVCLSSAKPQTVFLGYQDSLGQYSFGYSAPGSARSEVRTSNGETRGTYSYVDNNGVIQSAQYVADEENGFRIVATNLPEAPLPVQDTPEVVAARNAHLQALEMAEKRVALEKDKSVEESKSKESMEMSKEKQGMKLEMDTEARKKSSNVEMIGSKSMEGANEIQMAGIKEISGNPQNVEGTSKDAAEAPAAKAAQQVANVDHISTIPVIPSHVLTPYAAGNSVLSILASAQMKQRTEGAIDQQSSSMQAALQSIMMEATASDKKSDKDARNKESSALAKEEQIAQQKAAPIEGLKTIVAPINIVPLSSSHSNFVRYYPSVRYVIYNV